jgi:hypothetical protein
MFRLIYFFHEHVYIAGSVEKGQKYMYIEICVYACVCQKKGRIN